jgi:WD40 repeat protein
VRETGWERAAARVLDSDGKPAGAAFLIPAGLLLTCSHVISGVIGLPAEQPLPADAAVVIDFPLASGAPRLPARAVFSMPVGADNTGDMAVLCAEGPLPPDVAPLRLIEADGLAGHRWRAFGFPWYREENETKDAGIWTSGMIRGREGTGWWQLAVDPGEAFLLARGFSGAAVWDEEYQGVVGMVVTVESDPGRRTGYALTVEALAAGWPALRADLVAGCPYRGLRPFTELDAGVFFGRANETEHLAELVRVESRAIVPVLGPSGVGKSSIVGAGLITRLTEDGGYIVGRIPHGASHPAEELLAWALASPGDAAARGPAWQDGWRALAASMGTDGGVVTAAERVLAGHPDGTRLLVVVDQFEELALAAPQTARRLDGMLGALTGRWPDGTRRVQAVVVARIDFLKQLEAFPHITEAWKTTNLVISPMTRGQLREVVNAPLGGLGGISFARGLADQILHDTPSGPAALPMLEYTLTQLWHRQERGVISTAAYRELGGVEGALAQCAEQALWERADPAERPELEQVLIQLVRPGELLDAGGRAPDTRRVASRGEFGSTGWALIHRLASTRLVAITRQPSGPDTAELAHEALIGAWPRLAAWVEANRGFRTWQEALRRALREWLDHDQAAAFFLDNAHLAEARDWALRRPADLSRAELEFVQASGIAAARRRRWRRYRSGAAAVAAILIVAVGIVAFQQHVSGTVQHKDSLSQQLANEAASLRGSEPNLAKQLAVAAYQTAHTPAAFSALSGDQALPGSIAEAGVTDAAFGDHGLLALVAGSQVRLWSTTGHAVLAVITASAPATWAAFGGTAARNVLAIGDSNGAVELWSVARPPHPVRLAVARGPAGPVEQVAFSPDGRLLASADWDHAVRLWDVATPASPRLLATLTAGSGVASSVAFRPDGAVLATADWDKTVRLWNVSDPRDPVSLARISDNQLVHSVAFSRGGQLLATGEDTLDGAGANVHLWNVADPAAPRPLAAMTAGSGSVAAVAFSPVSSALMATGTNTAKIWVWNVGDPAQPYQLPSLGGGSQCLAFSPDDQTLATVGLPASSVTGGPGDEVQLWSVAASRYPTASATVPLGSGPVAMDPSARLLAVSYGQSVQLWDISRAPRMTPLATLPGIAGSVAIASHGRQVLLATGGTTSVALWDVTDPADPRRLAQVSMGGSVSTQWGIDVAFSPDGAILSALGVGDGALRLWSVRNPSDLVPLSSPAGAPALGASVSFGPGGRTIAVSVDNYPLHGPPDTVIWDLRDPEHPLRISRLPQAVSESLATALSPTASLLATDDSSGVVRLWSMASPEHPVMLATLSGSSAIQETLMFSPDGDVLVGEDSQGVLHIWDTADRSQVTVGPLPSDAMLATVSLPSAPSGGRTVSITIPDSEVDLPDGEVDLLDIDPGTMIRRLCTSTGNPVTPAQWDQYAPGLPYQPPCEEGR